MCKKNLLALTIISLVLFSSVHSSESNPTQLVNEILEAVSTFNQDK